jgi:hypothetical protein
MRCALIAGLAVVVTSIGTASAGVGLGVHGARWEMDGDTAGGYGVEAQAAFGDVFGVQVGYVSVDPGAAMPSIGKATPPDLRAELLLRPVPNRYVSPFLTLGVGVAHYAGDRVSLTAGVGAEVWLTRRWGIFGHCRVIAPDPYDVADDIERRHSEIPTAADLDGPSPMSESFGDIVDDYYNLRTYELSAGVRFIY